MKHVRGLDSEPALLNAYCADHLVELARPAIEAGRVWANFKNETKAYAQLLELLKQRQQGLCLYCEQRLVNSAGELVFNDYQVEHVLAKSGATSRVLDWTNLGLACGGGCYPHHGDESRKYTSKASNSCGQTKENKDLPVACDPRTFPLINAVTRVTIEGRVVPHIPNCKTAGIASNNLVDAIALTNLDCERLRLTRQKKGDSLRSWFEEILREIAGSEVTKEEKFAKLSQVISSQLAPDEIGALQPFWSTLRSNLGEPAERWIDNRIDLFT